MIKFSCEKVFLQNAIAVTSRAVAQKSSIPALEGLLLHADQQLTISGYNMQTGIRTNVFANVVEGGDIVLNARLFGDIIAREKKHLSRLQWMLNEQSGKDDEQ